MQPPDEAYALGSIFKACLPGIVALGVAAPEEIGIDTLQRRLDDERRKSRGIHLGAAMFGAWAHVRRLIRSADTGRLDVSWRVTSIFADSCHPWRRATLRPLLT